MKKSLVAAAARSPTADQQEWLRGRIASIGAVRARQENFPVASPLLRATTRRDLLDIYALARLIDDVGDEAPGDRTALLDLLDADIGRLAQGAPTLVPVAALVPAVRERNLPVNAFHNLVAANRMDQEVTRYADLAALREYCRLSAEPVGRLVLSVWNLAEQENTALSDDVCTGLQITEHLQDVAEDLAAGRIYLPQDALTRHGVSEAQLAAPSRQLTAAERTRVAALLADVAGEARELLAAGVPLSRRVPGLPRIAVAGFTAGGLAALDAVLKAGADAVHTTPKPKKPRVLRHTLRTLLAASRSR